MRSWTVLAILIATALAGCSDDAPAESDEGTLDVETTSDLGAISGVVVDETVVPIDGANVTLNTGETTTTDSEGRFAFESLDPATYFMEVSAQGFLGVQSSAQVTAGEVAKPRVQLERDMSPQPYHTTHRFDGQMVVYGTVASFALHLVLQEAGMSICTCEWDIPLDAVPEDVIIEGYWKDSVPDPRGPQQYYLEVFDSDINDCLETGSYPSGFRAAISGCTWSEENYRVALTGPSDWIAVQQSYELFVTPFYREAAPEDWSFIEGE